MNKRDHFVNERLNRWFKDNDVEIIIHYSHATELYYTNLFKHGNETDIESSGENILDAVNELLCQLAYEI